MVALACVAMLAFGFANSFVVKGTVTDENGQPIFREDGKILKSNLYFKPNIKSILEK